MCRSKATTGRHLSGDHHRRAGELARRSSCTTRTTAAAGRSCCCTGGRWTAGPGSRSCTRCSSAGYRVITYDRRGFGRSSRPTSGYDFDTLAADLDACCASSTCTTPPSSASPSAPASWPATSAATAPTGCKAASFIESLAPSFAKSDGQPQGVDAAGVAGVQQAILDDRLAWLTGLIGDFLNLDDYQGKRVSEDTVRAMWNAGAEASPYATWACAARAGWTTSARTSSASTCPTLIIHGTADRILSIDGQGRRLHAALPDAELRRDRGRPARHVRDPRRGGQPRAARVPRRAGAGDRPGTPPG